MTADILANAKNIFKPQPGPQTDFLSSSADIVIYGGAAGAGKTYAELLESLRHHQNPKMRVTIFRREGVQITNPGGLWDEACKIYPVFGATSNKQMLEWKFPSGFVCKFAHLQNEGDVHNWQGSQIPCIMFDELTHFTSDMFWYMLSRNRSDSGVPGYIRATTNPPDGVNPKEMWVAELIDWWLLSSGFPDYSKSGVVRWFTRQSGITLWGDNAADVMRKYDVARIDCKSFTFIPATIADNQILLQHDPAYISNLKALNENDKQRLLLGNWKVSSAGTIFNDKDFKVFVKPPADIKVKIITCDTAQKVKEHNDYTVMQCWALADKGIYLIDQIRGKFEYPELKRSALSFLFTHSDVNYVYIEDTVAGTSLIQDLMRDDSTRTRIITPIKRRKDKFTRAQECMPYLSGGYIYLNPMTDYYNVFRAEMVAFRGDMKHQHDDMVDCFLDAVDVLLINKPPIAHNSTNVYNMARRIC